MSEELKQLMLLALLGFIGYAASQGTKMNIELATQQIQEVALKLPEMIELLAQSQELIGLGVATIQETDPDVYEQLPDEIKQLAVTEEGEQISPNLLAIASAKQGAKLNYIRNLKGECPEGYEMIYMKAGGSVCPVCQKKKQKAKKVKKEACGGKSGISKAMAGIKTEMDKCGNKIKKHLLGGSVPSLRHKPISKPKVELPNGWTLERMIDEFGNPISYSYYGEQSSPSFHGVPDKAAWDDQVRKSKMTDLGYKIQSTADHLRDYIAYNKFNKKFPNNPIMLNISKIWQGAK